MVPLEGAFAGGPGWLVGPLLRVAAGSGGC